MGTDGTTVSDHWVLAGINDLTALGPDRVDWELYPPDPDFVVLADSFGTQSQGTALTRCFTAVGNGQQRCMRSEERREQTQLLAIYLNDHLTGATAGVELARRVRRSFRNNPDEPTMVRIAAEIDEDRATLVRLMRGLGLDVSRIKPLLGWFAEKLGRAKLNGRLLSRSPLSSLVELEAMRLGVEGKAAAWRTLHTICDHEPALDPNELQQLIDKAERQIEELESLRKSAATSVFGDR